MTQNEIEQQIQREASAFNNKKWNEVSEVPVPENIRRVFLNAVFVLPPAIHQIPFMRVNLIQSKGDESLTVIELGSMVNAIHSAPAYLIFKDLDEATKELVPIQAFKEKFNSLMDEQQKVLAKKKTVLSRIAAGSPMRSVGQA